MKYNRGLLLLILSLIVPTTHWWGIAAQIIYTICAFVYLFAGILEEK